MSVQSLFNEGAFEALLGARVSEELRMVANPILEKALEEARVAMQKRLAELTVGMLDRSYDLERHGQTLTIRVQLRGTDK